MSRDGKIILDFSQVGSLGEIHEMLKEKFGFPYYYGRNWDALYDCLGDFCMDCGECEVEVQGFCSMEETLRNQCRPMLMVFSEIQGEYPGMVFSVGS